MVSEMNGFQRRRELKRRASFCGLRAVFTRGIKDASIAEIAKKAEVSQVSIYNFFESKENLSGRRFSLYERKNERKRNGARKRYPFSGKTGEAAFHIG